MKTDPRYTGKIQSLNDVTMFESGKRPKRPDLKEWCLTDAQQMPSRLRLASRASPCLDFTDLSSSSSNLPNFYSNQCVTCVVPDPNPRIANHNEQDFNEVPFSD